MPIELVAVIGFAIYLLSELAVFIIGRFLKFESRAKYHDYLFEPLDPTTLPQPVADYFDRFTPDLERLAFRNLGDYLLQRGTTSARSRFFLAPDGHTVAGIDYWKWLWLRTRAYSFMSVFDDGTYLESAPMRSPADRLTASSHLRLKYFPGASPEDLYTHHQQAVRDHAASTGSELLPVARDNFKQVVNYGHRLLHHALHAKGLVPEPPPLPTPTEPTLTVAD